MSDKNGDKLVSREEFMAALKEPEVMRNFYSVEIDLRGAEGLFDILDYDDSGSLDVTEFIEGCMRARGGAKAKDVLALQCDLWRTQQGVKSELQALRDMMSRRFLRLDEEFAPLRKHILGEDDSRGGSNPSSQRELGQSSHLFSGPSAVPTGLGYKKASSSNSNSGAPSPRITE